jgi:hypothetical protein
MRPVAQMNRLEMEYPIQTQNHDCHQDNPEPVIIEDEIIHVLMLNESAVVGC